MTHRDLDLARVCLQQAKYAEAAVHCERILSGEPRHGDALMLLGIAQSAMGRADDGIGRLRAAVELEPDDEARWLNLGVALSRAGRAREAAACLRLAV